MREPIRHAMMWGKDEDGSIYVFPVQQTNGNWVKWEDYSELQAENEELHKDYEALADEHTKLIDRNARLKAEVERLTAENTAVKLGNAEWKSTAIERQDELIHDNSVIANLKAEVDFLTKKLQASGKGMMQLECRNRLLEDRIDLTHMVVRSLDIILSAPDTKMLKRLRIMRERRGVIWVSELEQDYAMPCSINDTSMTLPEVQENLGIIEKLLEGRNV